MADQCDERMWVYSAATIFFSAIEMEYCPHPALVVLDSKTHGLGVFTRECIPAGTVVERCAILESMVMRTRERPRSAMDRYTFFSWEAHPGIGFMPAGFGTMYNDGKRCCNVVHTLDMDTRCLTFTAIRDIGEGEELLMDYEQQTRAQIISGDSVNTQHGKEESTLEAHGGPASAPDESTFGRRAR